MANEPQHLDPALEGNERQSEALDSRRKSFREATARYLDKNYPDNEARKDHYKALQALHRVGLSYKNAAHELTALAAVRGIRPSIVLEHGAVATRLSSLEQRHLAGWNRAEECRAIVREAQRLADRLLPDHTPIGRALLGQAYDLVREAGGALGSIPNLENYAWSAARAHRSAMDSLGSPEQSRLALSLVGCANLKRAAGDDRGASKILTSAVNLAAHAVRRNSDKKKSRLLIPLATAWRWRAWVSRNDQDIEELRLVCADLPLRTVDLFVARGEAKHHAAKGNWDHALEAVESVINATRHLPELDRQQTIHHATLQVWEARIRRSRSERERRKLGAQSDLLVEQYARVVAHGKHEYQKQNLHDWKELVVAPKPARKARRYLGAGLIFSYSAARELRGDVSEEDADGPV